MHNRRRHRRRLVYRGAGLALLLPLLLGSGLVGGGGGGGGTPGTGDIEQVFSCLTGPCTTVTVDTGQSLGVTGTGTINATSGDSATLFFTTGELERTLLPAASADCGAGQFAKGIDADLVLDCAAPASGAPVDATYVTQSANATLTNEQSLGLLTTGLTLNTVTAGTGVLSTKATNTCTAQFPRSDNASGVWTCASIVDADVPNTITIDLATVATTANAGDSATAFFTVGELERTLMPAASGDCAASNWAKGIDADLVLDCSRPAFTDISGTATAAQIPAASADCAAGTFAKGIDAGLVLDCATPAGGAASNSFETWSTPAGTSPVADSATDTITLTAGTGVTITGSAGTDTVAFALSGITDASLASNYSGVGACGASTWASTLNDNAAPTCTQPAFTDITGSVTDAQVPNTITVDLATTATTANSGDSATLFFTTGELERTLLPAASADCSAGQFAKGIDADLVLDCAAPTGDGVGYDEVLEEAAGLTKRAKLNFIGSSITCADNAGATRTDCTVTDANTTDHGLLTGLTDDDHPQYTLLAGRTGTTNDTKLSSSADGTLYGSTTTAMDLILRANSADTTTGEVFVNAPSIRTPNNLTFDPDATSSQDFVTFTDGTETLAGIITGNRFASGTYTVSNNTSGIVGFNIPATVIMDYTAVTNPVFSSIASIFAAAPEIRPTGGATVTGTFAAPFTAGVTFNPTGASTIMDLSPTGDFNSLPIFKVTSSGAFGANSDRYGFRAKPTVSSGTVLAYRGLVIGDKTGAGTLSYQIGIEIPNLTGGTNNIGIRNASTTIYTPCVGTDPGATFTLTASCTTLALTPTGGARTSSATTAINDGLADGQIIRITNTGSANTVTIKNAANTDMTADCVMNRGGTSQFIWSAGESNWLGVSCSAN